MKRYVFLLCILFLLLIQGVGADPIDRPVALIKLHESEAVTQGQLKKMVALMEKQLNRTVTLDEKKQILDQMINEKLLLQAANKERISVTDTEVDQFKEQTKQMYVQQLGRQLSDDEFKTLVEQSGYTWDNFIKDLRKGLLAQKYIKAKKSSSFDKVPGPTDKEVTDYFFNNQTKFVSPEMVRFKQIFINPALLATAADKENAKKKAQSIVREIKAGKSFDNYWEIFDDSGRVKIGSMTPGLLRRDDQKTKDAFGADFFNAVFSMKTGEISEVVSSKLGYHIVLVLEKIPFKVLGIDDLIPPQNAMTVRNYIKALLGKSKEQEAVQQALNDLIQELKRTADIKIFNEYLSWN
jgi:parvulin-like peptidyl-prolyl isomerase